MFGSQILDVALGLTFVFLLFSLIMTAVRELIEAALKTRSADLEKGIRELLADPTGAGLARRFYEHPLIFSLFKGDYAASGFGRVTGARKGPKNLPSYIPSRTFAAVALDLLDSEPAPHIAQPSSDGQAAPENDPHHQLRAAVQTVSRLCGGDPERTREELEAWYDSAMDRVSGWYKRRTQILIFWTALALAIAANVNALGVGQALAQAPALREAIVADITANRPSADAPARELFDRVPELQTLGLPIGWSGNGRGFVAERLTCKRGAPACILQRVVGAGEVFLGWLLTALAISLGAPFWFDVLNKIMVIRSTVKPREKSGEEGSEDRRTPASPSDRPPAIESGSAPARPLDRAAPAPAAPADAGFGSTPFVYG